MRAVPWLAAVCWIVGGGALGRSEPAGVVHPSGPPPLLSELAWLGPETDRLKALTERPGECLRPPTDENAAYLVEVGRAAFNSPLLFGGQAARGGLSCASCHVDGRDNPDFFLAGLSGAAGTADVTSSVFSATREDGAFNPVAIPSLVDAARKRSFGTQAPAPTIHAFVESAIAEEFQGAPPPRAVLDGLVAYVEHLDRAACLGKGAARDVRADMAEVGRILAAAIAALASNDSETADFLIVSAQSALGRIHERYRGPALAPQREWLRDLSAGLAVARPYARNGAADASAMLERLSLLLPALTDDLVAHRRASLYDVETLATALKNAAE